MLALGLSAAVFLFLTVVGQAVLACLKVRFGLLRSWLLAPATGLATISVALMAGSQAGWPIRSLAAPLAAVLLVLAAAGLWWRRPLFPGRAMRGFGLAGLLFMVW